VLLTTQLINVCEQAVAEEKFKLCSAAYQSLCDKLTAAWRLFWASVAQTTSNQVAAVSKGMPIDSVMYFWTIFYWILRPIKSQEMVMDFM
jgi:hypothetical protein